MSPKTKSRRLFKIAKEFNVSTGTIIDALASEGIELANKPTAKITPEAYQILEESFGDEKAKFVDHQKTREQYESRRNQMHTNRNKSISIEDQLQPIEELEDEENVKEGLLSGLKPQEPEAVIEETLEAIKEEDVEETREASAEEPENEPEEPEAETAEEEEGSVEAEEKDEAKEAIEKEVDEKEEGGVIRGRAGRLEGTKVLGKVEVEKPKRRKKSTRKRKKDRNEKEERPKKEKARKSRKKNRRGVGEQDVDEKLRETMRKMKSSDTVGSRRQRRRKQRKEEREEEAQLQAEMQELENQAIEVTEFITVSDLADEMDVRANEVITTCMNLGMMVSINQRLDASTIELVAEEFGFEIIFVDADEAVEDIEIEEDKPEDLKPRAPIITVMGHVDHGKTSLLDHIRKTKVTAGEAGGITQHVGAYEVETGEGGKITFLDTPGHEAFTAMRSRGAQATDVALLVVAADDAVMPQTIEAINHSKAAGVPIIVAINKMDKPGANPDKIKQQLSEQDVIVEDYGGKVQLSEVSAKTGLGVDELLEKILIEAELMELKANPDRRANGVVLEARIDRGKGIVANILVQNGTLKIGDPFVAGSAFGRVRAMENEHGERVEKAGPSVTVQLTGFDAIPQAGDKMVVAKEEKKAKEVAAQRKHIRREQQLRRTKHLTLDDLSRRMALGEVSELNLVIKADVDGSIEALSGALQKISTDEVSINIIHTAAGAITQSDVMLASASDAIIIGFQVRPTVNARKAAEQEEIDMRLFSVIYDAVEEVKDAMEGLLSPEISEKLIGNAEVREIFKVSNVGTIAGCYVNEGKIARNNPVRVVRDGVVVYEGEVDALKRFKDDVKEVQTGYECGLSIVNYNDIKAGDVIENYEIVEEKRSLEDAKSFS